MTKLHNFLVDSEDEKPGRKLPGLKAVWKASDLKPKIMLLNKAIDRIRTQWKVWPLPLELLMAREDG
jgi:hypothetical protein